MSQDLDGMINELYSLKQIIREQGRELEALKQQARELEENCVSIMDDAGLAKAGTGQANMSLSEEVCPSVDSDRWDEVRRWVLDNEYTQLLPRSLNASPFRELHEMGITIPHVGIFVKRKVSLTKAR